MAVESELKLRQEKARAFVSPLISLNEPVWFYGAGHRLPCAAWVIKKEDDIPTPTHCHVVSLMVLDGNGPRFIHEVRHEDHPLAKYQGGTWKSVGYWVRTDHERRKEEKLERILASQAEDRVELASLRSHQEQFCPTKESLIEMERRFRRLEDKVGIKRKKEDKPEDADAELQTV